MTCEEEKNKNQSPDKALQDKEPQNMPLSSFWVTVELGFIPST